MEPWCAGTVLGFSDGEVGAIKTKRASLQPLSMRVGGWVRVISDATAANGGGGGSGRERERAR